MFVSDLGATLGKTGGIITRSRNEPTDFAKTKFVDSVKHNRVDFHYSGKRKDVLDGITIDQARWIGQLLSRLSDEQVRMHSGLPTTDRKKLRYWPARCARG